jgi:rhamnose utilization protein RhaD (predicted bifunctional aldolase and dehydrogenase)
MINLVAMAKDYLNEHQALNVSSTYADTSLNTPNLEVIDIAKLRNKLSTKLQHPLLIHQHRTAQTLAFANHPKVQLISQQGPATPDHVIRTKQLPMLGLDYQAYITAYKNYLPKRPKHLMMVRKKSCLIHCHGSYLIPKAVC